MPARGIGGALWMEGCRRSAVASSGLIIMSAGLPFAPPSCLVARRRAKLIGGGGSACAGTEPCCGSDGWLGCGGSCKIGCAVTCAGGGGGLVWRARGETARLEGGAFPWGPPTTERREPGAPPPAALAFGLRRPVRGGGCCCLACCCEWRSSLSCEGGCVVGAFAILTDIDGEPALTMPAVLPRRDSMRSFCCCLMLSIERTCSIAAVSSRLMGRPMTTGEIDFVASVAGVLTSVLIGCEMPLIVTRRFLLGDDFAAGG
ncbi:hypothetical protein BD311DRAFT_763388 [Dichomitus squalens]|uniref:Uncharacterized protein n=1 Tax=Dichomitus squalens TaxID=114155 RepID=A0A4Q9MGQ5_9APHY|nr:hypothetical protein BD311DRAFT_763388 [Dichomitus squalens]